MQKFVDRSGRVWVVEIDVATIKRVRAMTDINLLSVVEGDLIEQLMNDPITLCDVLYAICQPQAISQNVSDESFGQGLAGDVISDATAALLAGLVAFFPEPRRRLLQQAASKYRDVQTKAMAMVERRLESPELENQLLRKLEQDLAQPISSD
jgi:hypothetical protein